MQCNSRNTTSSPQPSSPPLNRITYLIKIKTLQQFSIKKSAYEETSYIFSIINTSHYLFGEGGAPLILSFPPSVAASAAAAATIELVHFLSHFGYQTIPAQLLISVLTKLSPQTQHTYISTLTTIIMRHQNPLSYLQL